MRKPFFDLPYAGSTRRMDWSEVEDGLQWLQDRIFMIRCEDDELPSVDWVLNLARAAVLRHGIRGLIIDPYNELDHQRPSSMTETEYVSQMLTKVSCKWPLLSSLPSWKMLATEKVSQRRNRFGSLGFYSIAVRIVERSSDSRSITSATSGLWRIRNRCETGRARHPTCTTSVGRRTSSTRLTAGLLCTATAMRARVCTVRQWGCPACLCLHR